MDPDDPYLVAAEAEALVAARPPGSVRKLAIGMSPEDAFSFENLQYDPGGRPARRWRSPASWPACPISRALPFGHTRSTRPAPSTPACLR